MSKYGSGDDGKSTYIASGERVWKDDVLFRAVGDLDELNSFIGLARVYAKKLKFDDVDELLRSIQSHLLVIGGELNTLGSDFYKKVPKLGDEALLFLENKIAEIEENLPKLKSFILPSGNELSAVLHICRTVCRRAERSVVSLHRERGVPGSILKYLNRLSTLMFVLARYVNYRSGYKDEVWRA